MGQKEDSMILIDTNIFVDHLRNYKPAVAYFESIAGKDDVLFSAITESELLAGNANNDPRKRETLLHFLSSWDKINVTNPIAVMAGDLSRKYGLSIPDSIIASTAINCRAELITRNLSDFKKKEGLLIRAPY